MKASKSSEAQNREPMNRRCMPQDKLDRSDIDTQGHGSTSFGTSVATELYEARTIKLDHLQFAELALQHVQRCGL